MHKLYLAFLFLALVRSNLATTLRLTKHPTNTQLGLGQTRTAHRNQRRAAANPDEFPLVDFGGTYTVDIDFGGITLPLVVDTGSSQLWVAAAGCEPCIANGMAVSDIRLPETCVDDPPAVLNYGERPVFARADMSVGLGASVRGCITTANNVTLGDHSLSNVSALAATDVTGSLLADAAYGSGLLGLGLSADTLDRRPTIISQLYQSGQIKSPTVGFYLARDDGTEESELTVGDVTQSSHMDDTKTVTLKNLPNPYNFGYYTVKLDSLNVNGHAINQSQSVRIDTGSNNLFLPYDVMATMLNALQDGKYYTTNGSYILPCDGLNSSTTLSFTFGEVEFPLNTQDLVWRDAPVAEDSEWCFSKLYNITDGQTWILGEPFLQNVYSAYNVESGDVSLYGLKS